MQASKKLSLAEVEEPLRIVVVYEDSSSHARARHIHDRLATHLGGEMQLEFSWWALDVLLEASGYDAAATATVLADLVIFSTRPGDDWQPAVKSWISSWVNKRASRPGAVAVVFTPTASDNGIPCGRQIMLQLYARRAGMDFLPQQRQPSTASDIAKNEFVKPTIPKATLLHEVGERPDSSPYWGING